MSNVDISEDATRHRVRNYTDEQLQALNDVLQFALHPQTEEEKHYIDVLHDECAKELKKRGLWLGR